MKGRKVDINGLIWIMEMRSQNWGVQEILIEIQLQRGETGMGC